MFMFFQSQEFLQVYTDDVLCWIASFCAEKYGNN